MADEAPEQDPSEDSPADAAAPPATPPHDAAASPPALAPYPVAMHSASEIDPWRNARGMNGMFSRSKGPPLWPFLLGAIAIFSFVGLQLYAASREAARREIGWQLDRELAQPRPGDVRMPDLTPATGRSMESVTASARTVCKRLAECGEMPSDLTDECVARQIAPAKDAMTRSLVGEVLDDVAASCMKKSCEEFADCYMVRLGQMAEAAGATTTPASTADRARLATLVCEVAQESNGHLPDLESPNASPKLRELKALVAKLGAAITAPIMRDAVNQCDVSDMIPPATIPPAMSAATKR